MYVTTEMVWLVRQIRFGSFSTNKIIDVTVSKHCPLRRETGVDQPSL